MYHQKTESLPLEQKSKNELETNAIKKVISWMIHNLKFLFIPCYKSDDLSERQFQYELFFPKKRKIKRYKSPLFIIAIISIFIFFTISIFPNWLSSYTYTEVTIFQGINANVEHYAPPSLAHPLGQTFKGFDILARIIYGARPVFIFTLTSTLISSLVGIFIGAISGYYNGWLDAILMRIMDIILSFPGVVFAILFILIFGSNFIILIITYSIIGIPYFARVIRTDIVKEKELPYISAARVSGARNFRIIFRHIIPNCMLPLIVAASFNIARNIISLAILGFLRFGDIGWIEWGYDISHSLNYFYNAPWSVLYPALMILISSMGFLLLGDNLVDNSLIRREVL
jgi:peptide/nickel transport system permease protein